VKVAVLGLGSAGRRHARNLLARSVTVTAYDPAPTDPPEGVILANGVESALDGVQAAVIASPNTEHAAHAMAALERGIPVLVEKPLAVDADSAQEIVRMAAERHVSAAVAMNLRFHPALLALRELHESGVLGRLHLAQVSFGYDLRRWREGDYRQSYSARSDLGGGILLDAIHEIDEILWLAGPVDEVSAECTHASGLEIDVEDLAVALLRFRTGALGLVDLNYFEASYRRGCLLVGDEATARWDWMAGTITVDAISSSHTIDVAADVHDTYEAVIDDFLGAVGAGRPPRTSLAEGLAAVRVCEAIKLAASSGRRVSLAG